MKNIIDSIRHNYDSLRHNSNSHFRLENIFSDAMNYIKKYVLSFLNINSICCYRVQTMAQNLHE